MNRQEYLTVVKGDKVPSGGMSGNDQLIYLYEIGREER